VRLVATSRFERSAQKLREPQASMLQAALRRFVADPRDPLLRTHELKDKVDGYWSFTVEADLRVLFRWDGDVAHLIDIGTHDEVY
jgi:mRNA-degrading endonuclease YafQ of YafQ-DinJ toxin-antitoxin module